MQRKLILYIAMSLDGYIAKPDDNIDFLSIVDLEGEDYGYAEFNERVDTVIWGRRTYDKVLSFGPLVYHLEKQIYVFSGTPRPPVGNVTFFTGNIKDFIAELRTREGKNIYIDGGAGLVFELMKENLIDEFIVSVIPICIGSGIPLFQQGRPETKLKLLSAKAFEKGLVQLHYERIGQD